MRLQALGLSAFVLALSLAPVATPATCKVGKAFDQVLADDTMIFASIRSVADLKKKFESDPYSTIAGDAEIKKWLDTVWGQITEEWAKMEKEAGFTPKDLWDNVEGEVALFLGAFDMKGDKPQPKSFGILVDAGGKNKEFSNLFARILKQMQEKEFNATTEKFNDVTIHIMDKKVPSGDPMGDRACAAQVGAVFMLVNELDVTKDVIKNLGADQRKSPLADHPTYKAIRDRVGKGEMFAFANLGFSKDLIETAMGQVPEGQKEIVEGIIKETGLANIKGAGLGFSLAKEGPRVDGFLMVDGYKGLTKIVAKNREINWQSVPKDASSASQVFFDMEEAGKFVDTLLKLAGDAMQAQGGGGDPKEMVKQFIGIDIKEDLIDLLGNEMWAFNRYSKPFNENSHEMVITWKLKNGKKFQETVNTLVERIAGFSGKDVESEEVMGTKVLKFKPDPSVEMEFGLAVHADKLVYGNLKGVREAIKAAPADGSWKDREDIRPVAAMVPAKAVMAAVWSSEDLEYVVTMLKEGKGPMGKIPDPGVEKIVGKNAKDLPSPETVKKYFQGGVWYAVAEDSGLSLVGQFLLKNITK